MRFDLEAELEKLVKLMKQLEILPSDIEQLVKVHIYITPSYCVLCACMHTWVRANDPLAKSPLLLIQQLIMTVIMLTPQYFKRGVAIITGYYTTHAILLLHIIIASHWATV